MFKANPAMIEAGYRPISEVADVTGRHRTTIFRMVQNEELEAMRDGQALYVSVESLITYYTEQSNPVMVKAIRKAFG
jgi:hypothetical protein